MQLCVPPAALAKGCPGILHSYTTGLVAFEHTRDTHHSKPHTLIFIGGLGDGLRTVEYVADIVETLHGTKWSVFEPVLSSSYTGLGTGSIGREIAQCVRYVREYKEMIWGAGKVVLMGHSTGCQVIVHYLSCANPHPRDEVVEQSEKKRGNGKVRSVEGTDKITRPAVDGAIIQAPVSDREAILWGDDNSRRLWRPSDHAGGMSEGSSRAVAEVQRSTYEGQGSDYGCLPITHTLVPVTVTAFFSTFTNKSRKFNGGCQIGGKSRRCLKQRIPGRPST